MKTLHRVVTCHSIVNALLDLNQESFVRDKKTCVPISVEWDIEKHSKMFGHLLQIRDELDLIINSLNQL